MPNDKDYPNPFCPRCEQELVMEADGTWLCTKCKVHFDPCKECGEPVEIEGFNTCRDCMRRAAQRKAARFQ